MHFLWYKLVYWVFSIWEKPRNFARLRSIIFAPLLEELVYRGFIFGLYRDIGYFDNRPMTSILLLPLYFSLAHCH